MTVDRPKKKKSALPLGSLGPMESLGPMWGKDGPPKAFSSGNLWGADAKRKNIWWL
jgi:hypothetical protein